ncbi:hypothetical protein BS50DRAFT_585120 [Corynespora cassiicola Philippines]|uniref:Uncharacterized protein n=1 Tax=Corynespora cassiicola Philippines TaxID=1448308 RepID=A0A2T2NVZ1_CORCC|nr:hypothetical protein BS50DRAFT_585120 [Corynespora cassiicola Philippines]
MSMLIPANAQPHTQRPRDENSGVQDEDPRLDMLLAYPLAPPPPLSRTRLLKQSCPSGDLREQFVAQSAFQKDFDTFWSPLDLGRIVPPGPASDEAHARAQPQGYTSGQRLDDDTTTPAAQPPLRDQAPRTQPPPPRRRRAKPSLELTIPGSSKSRKQTANPNAYHFRVDSMNSHTSEMPHPQVTMHAPVPISPSQHHIIRRKHVDLTNVHPALRPTPLNDNSSSGDDINPSAIAGGQLTSMPREQQRQRPVSMTAYRSESRQSADLRRQGKIASSRGWRGVTYPGFPELDKCRPRESSELRRVPGEAIENDAIYQRFADDEVGPPTPADAAVMFASAVADDMEEGDKKGKSKVKRKQKHRWSSLPLSLIKMTKRRLSIGEKDTGKRAPLTLDNLKNWEDEAGHVPKVSGMRMGWLGLGFGEGTRPSMDVSRPSMDADQEERGRGMCMERGNSRAPGHSPLPMEMHADPSHLSSRPRDLLQDNKLLSTPVQSPNEISPLDLPPPKPWVHPLPTPPETPGLRRISAAVSESNMPSSPGSLRRRSAIRVNSTRTSVASAMPSPPLPSPTIDISPASEPAPESPTPSLKRRSALRVSSNPTPQTMNGPARISTYSTPDLRANGLGITSPHPLDAALDTPYIHSQRASIISGWNSSQDNTPLPSPYTDGQAAPTSSPLNAQPASTPAADGDNDSYHRYKPQQPNHYPYTPTEPVTHLPQRHSIAQFNTSAYTHHNQPQYQRNPATHINRPTNRNANVAPLANTQHRHSSYTFAPSALSPTSAAMLPPPLFAGSVGAMASSASLPEPPARARIVDEQQQRTVYSPAPPSPGLRRRSAVCEREKRGSMVSVSSAGGSAVGASPTTATAPGAGVGWGVERPRFTGSVPSSPLAESFGEFRLHHPVPRRIWSGIY